MRQAYQANAGIRQGVSVCIRLVAGTGGGVPGILGVENLAGRRTGDLGVGVADYGLGTPSAKVMPVRVKTAKTARAIVWMVVFMGCFLLCSFVIG